MNKKTKSSKMLKNVNRKFKFSYFRLNYKEKFIRTLWVTPLILLLFLIPSEYMPVGNSKTTMIIICSIIYIIQLTYTYFMWKKWESD